jgi:hypothetical protein
MFQSGNEEQQKSRDLKFTEWSNDQGSFAQMDRMVAIICFYGTQVKKRLSSSWSNVPDYLANMEQLYNSFLRPIKDAATQKRLDNEFSEIWGIIRGQRGQLVNGNVYDIGQTINGISKFLHFNDTRCRDLMQSILRIPKFQKRGFILTKRELSKMLLKLYDTGFDDKEVELIKNRMSY